ncbi:hypothetical protein H0H81_012651 [Sphagnurus paluster]|uniref:Uncharacterized protein n=1 Tax=Sphagnurus paluster TaxID=117069 RepID=A0A9P7FWL2_9AGAR|nr:hypothetical protein H0H81_012651 [Sphagnurus paluster]
MAKRLVRAQFTGTHRSSYRTDSSPEAQSTWYENMEQIGPVLGSDKVTFHVEQLLGNPWLHKTIASSKEYTFESLLVMQGKQGDKKSITIPLRSISDGGVDATLLVQVRQPTSKFVAKQANIEAEMLRRRRDLTRGIQTASH